MKRMIVPQLLAAVVALVATASAAQAQHPWSAPPPPCNAPCAAPCPAPCPAPCCDEIKKICRPEVGTKKVTKYWYDCRCEDLCVPKCSCHNLRCNIKCRKDCCNPCPEPCDQCHDCDCPRVVKKLIKYPKVVEECDYKCVPECVVVPKCQAPCGHPGYGYGQPGHGGVIIVAPGAPGAPAAPAKPAELLPPPKVEKQQ